MNFSCVSPDEIRAMYRDAADKKNMIGVLAELTLSTKDEIIAFLGVTYVPSARRKSRVYSPLDVERARKLYDKRLNDREMAQELRVSKSTVQRWRGINNLPPNTPSTAKVNKGTPGKAEAAHDRCMELYQKGLQDAEIGAALRMSKNTIFKWRKRNDLPPNGKRGGYRERKAKGSNENEG